MRKILLLSAATLSLTAGCAMAADVSMPTAYDWTGFYTGVIAEYGTGGDHWPGDIFGDDVVGITPGGIGDVGSLNVNGVAGGIEAGANWQSGNWVLGVEADMQLSGISDSDSRLVAVPGHGDVQFNSKDDIDWFSTIRLRSGFAMDNVLLYGTGGIAIAGVNYNVSAHDGSHWSDDYTATGWTAGGGVEWAFSERWTAKLEYLYYGLGHKAIAGTGEGKGTFTKATPSFQTVRLGVNFKL